MPKVTFADIVSEELSFAKDIPANQLILDLIDNKWVQRLRDVSQTGNTRLVYMYSEHSRFGHSLGVASLANKLLNKLAIDFPEKVARHRLAISATALLHDIAHLAPGSHTAQKVWFPAQEDHHEKIAGQIILNSESIQKILNKYSSELSEQILGILNEDSSLPQWTWQIISGGGWNIDRGNWCIADSKLAGVSYGEYNISALTDSISINQDDSLVLKENRLDAMLHFAVSRHAMYKQIYQHRVLLAADELCIKTVQRCRDLGNYGENFFADQTMKNTLSADTADDLTHQDIYKMRESWWRYHLMQWTTSSDPILSDLSNRILNRRLFKTVTIDQEDKSELKAQINDLLEKHNLDPKYYLISISSVDRFIEDSNKSLKVILEDGSSKKLEDTDGIYNLLLTNASEHRKEWYAIPAEIKDELLYK